MLLKVIIKEFKSIIILNKRIVKENSEMVESYQGGQQTFYFFTLKL